MDVFDTLRQGIGEFAFVSLFANILIFQKVIMSTSQTEAVLAHNLSAIGSGDPVDILTDYSEESVLHTPDGRKRGLSEIQAFFEAFSANAPGGFMDNFEMVCQLC